MSVREAWLNTWSDTATSSFWVASAVTWPHVRQACPVPWRQAHILLQAGFPPQDTLMYEKRPSLLFQPNSCSIRKDVAQIWRGYMLQENWDHFVRCLTKNYDFLATLVVTTRLELPFLFSGFVRWTIWDPYTQLERHKRSNVEQASMLYMKALAISVFCHGTVYDFVGRSMLGMA